MPSQETTHLSIPTPAVAGHALIIEDEELIAAAIEAELRDLGFTSFDVAKTEHEAVARAAEQAPAFITVDAKLKEGDGVHAVLEICQKRPVPVIVVTGYPFDVTLSGVVTLGKPFTTAAFQAAFEQAKARPLTV